MHESTSPRALPQDASGRGDHTRATARPPSATQSGVRERVSVELRPSSTGELEARLLAALRQRDTSSALLLASRLVYLEPTHDAARRIKVRCASRKSDAADFPGALAVPRMVVTWDSLVGQELSAHAAYMLSLVDGSTVDALVDASALRPLAAYEALDGLRRAGIIAFG
jgi:hypothetical protein